MINIRKQIAAELIVMVSICLALGFLGPFGTYEMPAATRFIYWVSFGLIGYLLFRPLNSAAGWLHQAAAIPNWLCILLACAVASLPMTVLIAFAIARIANIAGPNPYLSDGFALLYFQVFALGCGVYGLMYLLFGRNSSAHTASDKIPPVSATKKGAEEIKPPLYDRLSAGFSGPIIALGVEDHYVRVYYGMDGKSEMLLLRLSDAIAEMTGIEGVRVHRSWWAASAAVQRATRDGRNIRLLLNNGLQLPVSRKNIPAIRAAGWL